MKTIGHARFFQHGPVLVPEGWLWEYVDTRLVYDLGYTNMLLGTRVQVYWNACWDQSVYCEAWLAPAMSLFLKLRDKIAGDWGQHCYELGLIKRNEQAPWPRFLSLGWGWA